MSRWPRQSLARPVSRSPLLADHREFRVERFIRKVRDLGPGLRELGKRGFATEDETIPGGWRVRPAVFLWWLADELTCTVRSDEMFEAWLQAEVLEGALTRRERQQLSRAAKGTMATLQGSCDRLIEAAAQGVGGNDRRR